MSRRSASTAVNGIVVYENGKRTGRFPGRVLHRPSLDDRIEAFVREEMARQRLPGLAVGIVHKGRVSARGYGYATVEHLVPVTDETIFQSGSLGKMFTAAAVVAERLKAAVCSSYEAGGCQAPGVCVRLKRHLHRGRRSGSFISQGPT